MSPCSTGPPRSTHSARRAHSGPRRTPGPRHTGSPRGSGGRVPAPPGGHTWRCRCPGTARSESRWDRKRLGEKSNGRQESKRLSREHDCYRIERWDSWLMVPRQRPMARRKLDFEIKGISLFDVFSLMFETLTHYKLLQRIYPD